MRRVCLETWTYSQSGMMMTSGCVGMWENTKATDRAWLGRVPLPRRQNLAEVSWAVELARKEVSMAHGKDARDSMGQTQGRMGSTNREAGRSSKWNLGVGSMVQGQCHTASLRVHVSFHHWKTDHLALSYNVGIMVIMSTLQMKKWRSGRVGGLSEPHC